MLAYIGFPTVEQGLLEGAATKLGVLDRVTFIPSVDSLIETAKEVGAPSESRFPSIIFLNLDETDWREVLTALKANPSLKRVPVVGLGRITDQTTIDELYEFGANSYIQKPETFHEMVTIADACLKYWLECTHLPAPYLADL